MFGKTFGIANRDFLADAISMMSWDFKSRVKWFCLIFDRVNDQNKMVLSPENDGS